MRNFLLFFVFFLVVGFLFPVGAQNNTPRLAVCDMCGYCPPNSAPSNWAKCAVCLYGLPEGTDPSSNITLKIDESTNLPPKTLPGRMFTQLGCISTNLGGFQQEGAAAGVVQTLLNVIFSIVGGLGLVSLIYGSFVIITSQSNPERLNYGKRIVYGAIVGIIFSLSAVFLVNIIGSGILKLPSFNSVQNNVPSP